MITLPTEAVGFHGTSKAAVPGLLDRHIDLSNNPSDWLGKGFYLWQDSPWRADEWATDHFGPDDAAVVAVRVSLDGRPDLLNPSWQALLREADAQFVVECLNEGTQPPMNNATGNRARDCATINWFEEQMAWSVPPR